MSAIARRLDAIRHEIDAAAAASGRDKATIRLTAVAKFKPREAVEAALGAGQRLFGENRVQEAAAKYPELRQRHPDLELRLIGPLQSNKAADAVALFDVIETIDRVKIAEAVASRLAESAARCRQVLIQVNTGEEPQKAGILPAEADRFIEDCAGRLKLPVAGLMCIPPEDDEPSLHFALLREIAKRHRLPQLSMGMSSDFAIAIGQGATHVRVGTAIFGPRE